MKKNGNVIQSKEIFEFLKLKVDKTTIGEACDGKHGENEYDFPYNISIDSEGYTKSNLKFGRDVHKMYKQKKVDYKDRFKEYRLPSKKRIDFIDFKSKTIYELKPYNPSQIRKGTKQLEGYLKEVKDLFGSGWTTVLEVY